VKTFISKNILPTFCFPVASRLQDTHKRYNAILQELIKAHHADPYQELGLNKTGIVPKSQEFIEILLDRVGQEEIRLREEFMKPHKLFAARFEELIETQKQLEFSADNVSMLIDKYETLAFPPDLCSIHQNDLYTLPDFDDAECKIQMLEIISTKGLFLVTLDLEDAMIQMEYFAKQDQELKRNCKSNFMSFH
jgi:hypothetical protein